MGQGLTSLRTYYSMSGAELWTGRAGPPSLDPRRGTGGPSHGQWAPLNNEREKNKLHRIVLLEPQGITNLKLYVHFEMQVDIPMI